MSALCDGELTFKSIATNGYAMFIAMQRKCDMIRNERRAKIRRGEG